MTEEKTRTSSDQEKMDAVLQEALYCHVAFSVDDQPYVLPFSYGFEDGKLYIHTGLKGKKLDMLKRNPKVAFVIQTEVSLKEAKTACEFAMLYKSVAGRGVARLLEVNEEKRRGLDAVVRHYNAKPIEYAENRLKGTNIIEVTVEEMTYKETDTAE